jgi:pimeloyl-ACP methyl ester carboxylesterase
MKQLAKVTLCALILLLVGAGYWLYDRQGRIPQAAPEALAALQSDSSVTVSLSTQEWHLFRPTGLTPNAGLIFYPGGECDERAYAEPLRRIAAAGYLVALVPMPLKLAVLAADSASEVIAQHPKISSWTMAGHSLGGAMAARYAFNHPASIDGLILWDAYPADDMADTTLKTAMIHRADMSGGLPGEYLDKLHLLPKQTSFVALPGALHMNFGRFKAEHNSAPEATADLDPAQQLASTAQASINFMNAL